MRKNQQISRWGRSLYQTFFCFQSPGAKLIISGSNSEVSDEDHCQSILDSINNMENRVLDEINEELFGLR